MTTIRIARDEDAPTLAELASQLGYPTDTAAIRRRLERIAERDAGRVLVGVGAEGRVLGWLHVAPVVQLEYPPFAEIAGLVVDEHARSSGVGAKLVAAAEQWALEQGFDELRVRSRVERERAHGFYERAGFQRIKTQAVFVKRLEAL